MSEMVDQVARAIWLKLSGPELDECEEAARAAMEAMRAHLVSCATRDNEQSYYAAVDEIDDALKCS